MGRDRFKQIECATSWRTSKKDTQTREVTKQTWWHWSMSIHFSTRWLKTGRQRQNVQSLQVAEKQSPEQSHVAIHKDNSKYLIEFTVDKTIPKFNKGAEKCNLTWVDSFTELKMCSKDSTGLPRNRRSTSTSQSPSAQRCLFWSNKITTPAKTFIKLFSSFFSGHWMKAIHPP